VLLHEEHGVERIQHLGRLAEVHPGERPLTQDVEHADRVHRRLDAVPRDVHQARDQVIGVQRAVAECVTAERGGGAVVPVHPDVAGANRGGQERLDVVPRLLDVPLQLGLALHLPLTAPLVLEEVVPELDPVVRRKDGGAGESVALHERAVARAEVLDDDLVGDQGDLEMEARDLPVEDDDGAGGIAADGQGIWGDEVARDGLGPLEDDEVAPEILAQRGRVGDRRVLRDDGVRALIHCAWARRLGGAIPPPQDGIRTVTRRVHGGWRRPWPDACFGLLRRGRCRCGTGRRCC